MLPTLVLASLLAVPADAPAPPARKKIVLLAGKKSHGPVGNGIHELRPIRHSLAEHRRDTDISEVQPAKAAGQLCHPFDITIQVDHVDGRHAARMNWMDKSRGEFINHYIK